MNDTERERKRNRQDRERRKRKRKKERREQGREKGIEKKKGERRGMRDLPCSMTSIRDVLSRATLATLGAWTFLSFSRPSSMRSSRPECFCSSCFSAAAKESWDLFSLSLIWLEIFLASLQQKKPDYLNAPWSYISFLSRNEILCKLNFGQFFGALTINA